MLQPKANKNRAVAKEEMEEKTKNTPSFKHQAPDYLVKVILIGDSGAGKSCLLLRYTEDYFTPTFITTIGIDFKVRTQKVGEKTVKIQIWDTAGQERYRTITGAYFRGAHATLLVYSVTDRDSFSHVEGWLNSFRSGGGNAKHVALVGNKIDLESRRVVSSAEGAELAARCQLRFGETSALSGQGVRETFDALVSGVVADFAKEEEKIKPSTLNLVPAPEEKKNCSC